MRLNASEFARAANTALDNLGANPLRTVLSTLGVIIGVAALVAILALADGLERYSREAIGATTDLQVIVARPVTTERQDGIVVRRERVARIDRADLAALREALGSAADATLDVTGSARLDMGDGEVGRAVLLNGTLPAGSWQLPGGLTAGRFLRDDDVVSDARVAVATGPLASWLGVAPEELPGRTVLLDGVAYELIGVAYPELGQTVRFILPLSDVVRGELEGPTRPVGVVVRAMRVEEVEAVRARVEGWLAERYAAAGANAFTVESNRGRAEQARQGMLAFKLVMGSIAGIALLVGGIGVMNILLASVFERTREIGIRRATGARKRDIRLQFLAESITICGIGSVLGVALGLTGAFGITAAIRHLADLPLHAAFAWGSVLVAAGAAIGIGLVFGMYPAQRAARLSPIEALRHE